MEFTYPLANTDYHGYSRKVGRDRDDHHMQDDGNELYLRWVVSVYYSYCLI